MISRMTYGAIAVVLSFVAIGCAGDPPSISNLSLIPDRVTVGETTQINGGLDFADPDGDIEELFFGLSLNGSEPEQASQDVPEATDFTDGRMAFILMLTPPEAGPIDVEVWLVDADGSESNRLTTAVTAE